MGDLPSVRWPNRGSAAGRPYLHSITLLVGVGPSCASGSFKRISFWLRNGIENKWTIPVHGIDSVHKVSAPAEGASVKPN